MDSRVKKLYEMRLLKKSGEVFEFEKILNNIAEDSDLQIIPELCEVFDDSCDFPSSMDALKKIIFHIIKKFDLNDGLLQLANGIPKMLPHAEDNAIFIHYNILNDDKMIEAYRKAVKKVDEETRETIISLLEDIKDEEPDRFGNKVDQLLAD